MVDLHQLDVCGEGIRTRPVAEIVQTTAGLARRKGTPEPRLPFGPPLLAGALLGVLAGGYNRLTVRRTPPSHPQSPPCTGSNLDKAS